MNEFSPIWVEARDMELATTRGDGSCIWVIKFLLSGVVDRPIAGVRVFVYFTMADALEASGAGKARPDAADAGEHIKVTNHASITLRHRDTSSRFFAGL